MEILFWSSTALIGYVYFGYPGVLAVWAHIKERRSFPPRSSRTLPAVSVVIAARNEAHRLPARIDNLLAGSYPTDRLQIIVASDGSTDDTVQALAPYAGRITLLNLPAAGKAGALNAAVAAATNPILVFADARQRFDRNAIRWLVTPFADSAVGAVSGELVLDCEVDAVARGTTSTIGEGVGAYWRYEKWLRRREAVVGSLLGVSGAIYAMRRGLWRPLPADTILDDVLTPMRVVLDGYRVTLEERARAYDTAAPDASRELQRKTRTLAGNFQLLSREPRLLLPWRNPVWLQFVSHKVGRLIVPYALIGVFISSATLATTSAFHRAALMAQLVFYGLAAYGAALDRRARATSLSSGDAYGEAA